MRKRICVINPNSDRSVTLAMDRALQCLRFADGPSIECETLEDAPLGIETARDVDSVVGPLCDLITREEHRTDAFVIACFGDPGLASARETTSRPVVGICEAGITTALNYGERYGILANLACDVNPGLRHVRALGLDARLAGIEAVGIAVVELSDSERAQAGLLAATKRLKTRGCDVVILGCAGMLPYGSMLSEQTGLQIVDPVHAGTGMAMIAVSS